MRSLFAAALLVRLAAMVLLGSPGEADGISAWEWGGEAPALARTLAEGRGFGDPWGQGTGPSAWLTPVYPALLALLMLVGGGVTSATAWMLFSLQSVVSAATCLLLVRLGQRLAWPQAGRLAGWLFALYPLAIWNAAAVVWDTTLVAFGVTAFLWALLARGRSGPGLAGSGLAFGALLFLNPAPVGMLPAVLAWIALDPERPPGGRAAGRAAARCALFVLSAVVVCLPWMVRNRVVLGTWQLRPNFGVELRLGNHDQAEGRPVPFRYHPSHVEEELALYRELGEADYGRENTRRALGWIRANPGRTASLTLRRLRIFWLGELPTSDPRRSDELAPGRDPTSWIKFLAYLTTGAGAFVAALLLDLPRDRKVLILGALALFGAPYYLTHVSERYRFPVDPLLVLLDAWLVLWLLRPRSAWTAPPVSETKG